MDDASSTRETILGVEVQAQTYEHALSRFLETATAGRRLRAHFVTVHSLTESARNHALRGVFASSAMVCTDGMPIVWVARLRGARTAERVCGPDVMLSLCDRGRSVGLRHYFLGGRPGTPESLAERLTARYPGLIVVGTMSPPFRELSADKDQALVDTVNLAKPDVLWIGLGSPKQEFWAAEHEAALEVPLILPVGAAFDFHSGRLRRAPRWMRRLGLEWLFRLAMEPRRLFRRYLTTNARFVVLVCREEMSRRRRGR